MTVSCLPLRSVTVLVKPRVAMAVSTVVSPPSSGFAPASACHRKARRRLSPYAQEQPLRRIRTWPSTSADPRTATALSRVILLPYNSLTSTKSGAQRRRRRRSARKKKSPRTRNLRSAGRKNDKKKDDAEVNGQGLILFEEQDPVCRSRRCRWASGAVVLRDFFAHRPAASKKKQEAGRHERERDKGDTPAARSSARRSSGSSPRISLYQTSPSLPSRRRLTSCKTLRHTPFVASIKRHPINFLHPFGSLVEKLGLIGDVEVETSALSKDSNEDFANSVMECVPPTVVASLRARP
ncbi:unnamed protein product [Peniophora sp. CBMAI 1063]|nr:unnamed protein product [Peniophora sp. CBMAI 1063]